MVWFFKLVYALAIISVFFFFHTNIGIDNWVGVLIYSLITVALIEVISLIFKYTAGYKFISAFLTGFIFLGLAFLLITAFKSVFEQKAISLIMLFLFLYIGLVLGYKNSNIFEGFFSYIYANHSLKLKMGEKAKILDTSTLIDARISNLVDIHFIEGKIYIPVFVLKELQNIADSHDHLRRQKGRRGLNVVKRLQEQSHTPIILDDTNFDGVASVDEKLVLLAQKLGATIITTDYNLLKVADIQQIATLNINSLATAVRQTLLPGEEIDIYIAKEGKEQSQGVGYLEDGTMVVIENGKKFLGQTLHVEVTSLLQTDSGRIIFAKIK